MHLGCSQTRAISVFHRLEHVLDQPLDFGRSRVYDFFSRLPQNGVAHFRDFQNSHKRTITLAELRLQGHERPFTREFPYDISRDHFVNP